MVMPDTQAHLDGHFVLTNTYSIFLDMDNGNPGQSKSKEASLHLERIQDPYYYGYITLELPGKVFTYTANGETRLNEDEVEEVIEDIIQLRTDRALWPQVDDL